MIGQSLGHYQILEKIGSGGMGDVYLAEDTKLDRKVALKVLPPELADNEDRRARFQREAKAIAALNHPNIVTVHSVEEVEATHFITMERVNGRTLTEMIPKNGMPLDQFLELSIPLADAVASAHEAGIVHRDLKPANIMVTVEGRLKVLDFGLAHQDAPIQASDDGRNSESPTELKTQEGVLAGTLHYMSPEQVEGKSIDARSDVFSLGILYYELLTGQGPFQGDSPASVISSILKDTPAPVTVVSPSLPRDVARIVRRCLVKERTRRFQSARDVVNELRELQEEMASGELQAPTVGTASRFRVPAWAGAAILAVGLITGYVVGRSNENETRSSNFVNSVQLTFATGVESNPSWSPDGGELAYHSDQDGDFDIWITKAGGGRPLNLTNDYQGTDTSPAWSPDGDRIAFRSARDGGGYFVMPALGGPARQVCSGATSNLIVMDSEQVWNAPRWSSDGSEIACLSIDETGVSVEIDNVQTREARRVALPASSGFGMDLSWSPDGRFFAFVDAVPGPDVTRLWIVSSEDGEGVEATQGLFNERSPSWSPDGRTLYYVSNRGGALDLWQQRLTTDGAPTQAPAPLTAGIGMSDASYSPDRTKVAYTRGRVVSNVWRVPFLEDRPARWSDAEQITFEFARVQFLEMSRDGRHLLMTSDRAGNVDIWMFPMDRGEPVQLTTHPTPDWGPSWSPDGTEFVFYSYRSGNRDIWAMPVAGGPARQLTQSDAAELVPAWSPRGDQILFSSSSGGSQEIWVMGSDGSEPRRLGGAGLGASWSPDGEWAVLVHPDGSLWKHTLEGGTPERLTSGPANPLVVWSGDGETMYFARGSSERAAGVWARSMADGAERKVMDFLGRPGALEGPSLTSDGDYLYFAWRETLGDIWVMDVVTDED